MTSSSSRFEVVEDGNGKAVEQEKRDGTDVEQVIEGIKAVQVQEGTQNESEAEEVMSEEQRLSLTKKASAQKELGNGFFQKGEYEQALECYTEALRLCPKKIDDLKYSRAVYFSNRAACCIQLERAQDAVDDCSFAIELDSRYVKAYMRRAKAYEMLDKHEEALKDFESVLEIDPTIPTAIESKQRLGKIVHEKQEKLKEEMMGKLKSLGNTILGKFGMSTNNFQMQQDPNTGSYNIQFVQNPPK